MLEQGQDLPQERVPDQRQLGSAVRADGTARQQHVRQHRDEAEPQENGREQDSDNKHQPAVDSRMNSWMRCSSSASSTGFTSTRSRATGASPRPAS